MRTRNKVILYSLSLLSIISFSYAAKQAPITELDTKNATKLEIRQGQIGYRSTLLFYTFKDQKAILRVHIGNKDKTFPVTATLYIFDKNTKEDGMKKWLNNQHSDGLFPNIPQPSKTIKLPAKVCKVTSNKFIDKSKQRFGEYDNYAVTLEVKNYSDGISFKLNGFKVNTKVHVKTK